MPVRRGKYNKKGYKRRAAGLEKSTRLAVPGTVST